MTGDSTVAKLVYYIATSLDGFIARRDGSFADFPWDQEFGAHLLATYPETFPAHLRPQAANGGGNARFGTVLMGRRTYEVGLADGITSPYPGLEQYVISRTLGDTATSDVIVLRDRVPERVREIKARATRDLWLCGGAELATDLMEDGLVDEIIVKVNPILLGDGIPLFTRSLPTTHLRPKATRSFPSGHTWMEYAVVRPA